MSRRTIWPDLTPGRRAWLERLEREGVVDGRGKGPIGFQCMRLGWTQWVRGATDGRFFGEALTDAGREVLRRARAAVSSPHGSHPHQPGALPAHPEG